MQLPYIKAISFIFIGNFSNPTMNQQLFAMIAECGNRYPVFNPFANIRLLRGGLGGDGR
jgi:hypothetical protein